MKTVSKLTASILRLNVVQDALTKKIAEAERRKQALLARLQAKCPHARVMAFNGQIKEPGEKSFSVTLRVCADCNLVEDARGNPKKLAAEPFVRADASLMERYEVLGRKLG